MACFLHYYRTVQPGKLRTIHHLTIAGETITTTRSKEILLFAKPRVRDRFEWKHIKEAVRRGESLEIFGGKQD